MKKRRSNLTKMINLRVTPEIDKATEATAKRFALSQSDVMRLFLQAVINEHGRADGTVDIMSLVGARQDELFTVAPPNPDVTIEATAVR